MTACCSHTEVGDSINKWSTEPASQPARLRAYICIFFFYCCLRRRSLMGLLVTLSASMHFHAPREWGRDHSPVFSRTLRAWAGWAGSRAAMCFHAWGAVYALVGSIDWSTWIILYGIAIQISCVVSLSRVTTRHRVQCAIWFLSCFTTNLYLT